MKKDNLMQAIRIDKPGGPDVLTLCRLPVPEPRQNEVLVRVAAAGVNRPDVLQRMGLYPLPPGADPLPGLEIAGDIVSLGKDVTRWQCGARVMALAHGGGYAEYCRVHEDHCLRVPDDMALAEAAAIPETFFTVWYNVFTLGRLVSGETLLVHGGSSGIGTTAIQLAKARGATVLTTAGSDSKCRFCEQLGADHAINYRQKEWPERVREFTAERGVDVILDMVAGPYAQMNIDALGRDGRYVIIAFLKGATAELNLRPVLSRRLTITGSTLRPQSIAEKAVIAENLRKEVMPLLETGAVRPIIHASFPLAEASAAHELMESSQHMGKIVLTLQPTRNQSRI
jgi:putative PIG3 family NAD(P)H quinone oxidoreductase